MEKLAPIQGSFEGCFGCGPDNARGLKLEFGKDADGSVVAEITMTEDLSGYRGFVHGGVIAAVLDEAMGWALLHVGGRYGVTRSMKIQYRRPARIGKTVTVRASIEHLGPRLATVAATIRDERGRALAFATGQWSLVRNERSA